MKQLDLQQRQEMAFLQELHEAQLLALKHQERSRQLLQQRSRQSAVNYTAAIANFQEKLSHISESLFVLFATLKSLTTIIPPDTARDAVLSLADMGTPYMAISGASNPLIYE